MLARARSAVARVASAPRTRSSARRGSAGVARRATGGTDGSSSSESSGSFVASAIALGAPNLGTLVYPTALALDGLGLACATPLFGESFEDVASVQHFSNLFGTEAFSIVAVTALYALYDAGKNDRLKSETYQRLALALVLYTGSFMAAFAVAAASASASGEAGPSAATCAAVVASFAPACALGVNVIREYGPGHDETWARVGKDFQEATRLGERSEKGGYLELFYKVSFWTSLVVGGSFAFSPLSPLAIVNETAPSSQLIQRAFGLATCFLLAPTQFVLLDAAKRGRLGGGTFKKLNLSIAAAITLIDWMTIYTFGVAASLNPTAEQMATASGGVYNYVGALGVSGAIVAVYLYQGLFAKK